jgi:hypothetical protein
MSEETKVPPKGSDWTRLLTDPDLVSHLGKLLQTYRDVPADQRESALLRTMREIKESAIKEREEHEREIREALARHDQETLSVSTTPEPVQTEAEAKAEVKAPEPAAPAVLHRPEPAHAPPPFETEVFRTQSEADRRRFLRLKCYVAVEIHVEGSDKPVWGNLANVSRGGCLVETASSVPPGKALEIGLWVASGKIWVKGVIISGVATRSASSFGVRVKFSQSELSEKEHLREFLKFVEGAANKSQSGSAYVAQLKT